MDFIFLWNIMVFLLPYDCSYNFIHYHILLRIDMWRIYYKWIKFQRANHLSLKDKITKVKQYHGTPGLYFPMEYHVFLLPCHWSHFLYDLSLNLVEKRNYIILASISGCIYLSLLYITGLPRILDLREYYVLIKGPMLMTALLRELR